MLHYLDREDIGFKFLSLLWGKGACGLSGRRCGLQLFCLTLDGTGGDLYPLTVHIVLMPLQV